MRRIGLLAVVAALTSNPLWAQTTTPQIRLDVSIWDLRRHVELVAAGADLVHAATETGLGNLFETASISADGRGRLFRIGKFYVVDLPTVAVAHTFAHEYGHAARNRENHVVTNGFRLTNWPWPVPYVGGVPKPVPLSEIDSFVDPRALGVSSGGYEAGRVRDRQFHDAMASGGRMEYFTAARLIYSRLEEPMAAIVYLRESQIQDQKAFFFTDGDGGAMDDMRAYAINFTGVLHVNGIGLIDAQKRAREIRRHAAWALMDLELLGSFYRVANYLWTGDAIGNVPAIKVGSSRFWPRATFALTPVGIARGGELHWADGGNSMIVRAAKTEQAVPLEVVGPTVHGHPTLADRTRSLWGGAVIASTHQRGSTLRVETNFWHQQATGRGGAVEISAERPIGAPASRTRASLSVGYKTRGFLAGAPDRAQWLCAVGLSIRP
jgi:hypothetical protein